MSTLQCCCIRVLARTKCSWYFDLDMNRRKKKKKKETECLTGTSELMDLMTRDEFMKSPVEKDGFSILQRFFFEASSADV